MLDRFPYYWTYYRCGAQDMHGVRRTLSFWNSPRGFGNGYQFIMRALPIDSQYVHTVLHQRVFFLETHINLLKTAADIKPTA